MKLNEEYFDILEIIYLKLLGLSFHVLSVEMVMSRSELNIVRLGLNLKYINRARSSAQA